MNKSQSGNNHVMALDRAYEAGRDAAFLNQQSESANPYGYHVEAALYWEWMRGFREQKFGA